jgi:hypothetical protein
VSLLLLFPPAGVSGSGSLAVTLDDVTDSASATVSDTGLAADTLDDLVSTASGAVADTGQGSGTLGALTLSATDADVSVRSELVIQEVVRAGTAPVYAAANAAGHSLPNSTREFVHVKTGGVPCTVTVRIGSVIVDGLSVADRPITVGANSERMVGPFPHQTYNQADGSGVHLDFDSVVAVTIAAFRL